MNLYQLHNFFIRTTTMHQFLWTNGSRCSQKKHFLPQNWLLTSVIARVYSFTWYFCLITQYAYVYRHDLFLFINLRKRLTIMNFELMRWMKFLTVQYLWFIYLYQCWQYVSIFQPKYMLPFCCYESILYWLSLLEGYVLIKAILKNHSMFYCPTFTLSEPRFSHYLNLRIHRIAPYIGRY